MLGDLSAEYESNGDPGTVSSGSGDLGGQSYGCYQFAINAGVVQAFVRWLVDTGNAAGERLAQYEAGTDEFNFMWEQEGALYGEAFAQAQRDYVQEQYYAPAVANLAEIGFDATARSEALQQVIWSRAVQYSARWVPDLFAKAAEMAGKAVNDCTDAELIYNIYQYLLDDASTVAEGADELLHSADDWVNGSAEVVDGLVNRFGSERTAALAMLGVIT